MLIKFFIVVIIAIIVPNNRLAAVDSYPPEFPDLFWTLRQHLFQKLERPTATRATIGNTLCEFVRACDYMSCQPAMKEHFRKDLDNSCLKYGLTEEAKATTLSVLEELEAVDFYTTRPIPGYTFTIDSADEIQDAAALYPADTSSFFWSVRDLFYECSRYDETTTEEEKKLLLHLIAVGDHVSSSTVSAEMLREDFRLYGKKRGITKTKNTELLRILSELEAENVFTMRPIPGFTALKSPEAAAIENAKIKEVVAMFIKQEMLVIQARSHMGASFGELLTPSEISDRLKVVIRGQDKAMDQLGVIGHLIMAEIRLKQKIPSWKFTAPHAFLVGKSGCGKTQSVIELCKIIGVSWIRINAPEVVAEGYKGPTLGYHYEQLKKYGVMPEYAVVILDEAAKMGTTGSGDDAPKYGGTIMRTLLAHMDGCNVKLPARADGFEASISTECFTYLATDACAHVPDSVMLTAETLCEYTGMPQELVNRFSQGIIRLIPHTTASLVDILQNNPKGAYAHKKTFFKELYGVDFSITYDGLVAIAERSIADSTGVRKLEEMLGHVITPIYNLPRGLIVEDGKVKKITLSREFVLKHLPPVEEKGKEEWRRMFS